MTPAPPRPRGPGSTPSGKRATVVSFFMDNIPDEIVAAQRSVVKAFNGDAHEFRQIRAAKSHGEAMDEALATAESDVLVFLDIDCVPIRADAMTMLVESAGRGVLVGCAQRANHLQNGGHVYAGPFCMAISRKLWTDLGRPSFRPTERGDVGEEVTWRCEESGGTVELIWPSHVEEPVWPLAGGIRFGFNTEYGGAFLHAFGIRHEDNRRRFLARCEDLLADRRGLSGTDDRRTGVPGWDATDKTYWHRYAAFYERAFTGLSEVGDILEFGVLEGDSVRALAMRFPGARIVGVDISPQKASWPRADNISYVQLDQGDRSAVQAMFKTLGRQYDIIIEDGSHVPQHQATCLIQGLPHVKPGRIYVLEDLHSSHPDNVDFQSHMCPPAPNALHMLLAFEHLKAVGLPMTNGVASNLAAPGYFRPDQVRDLFEHMSHIEIFRRSNLPLRCYRCGSEEFDYGAMRCRCGVDLYRKPDSMTCIIEKR